jgi:hypothetical protein
METIIEIAPVAVVECARPVRFLLGPSSGMGKAEGSAGRKELLYSDFLEVEGVSLDEFQSRSGNPMPDVVKMDIEGGEVLALPGMQRLLGEGHPLVFLELHGPEAAGLAWEMLAAAGYRLCEMSPGYPEIKVAEDLDWKAYVVATWERDKQP